MKKRRVLALFLALSITLSSNGFTALAAENDSAITVETDSSEETDEDIVSGENGEAGTGSNASEDGDKSEDGSGVSDDSDVTENGSDVSGDSDETGNGYDTSDENGESEDGSDAPDENGESGTESDSDESAEPGTESDASEETAEPEADIDETAPSEKVQSYNPLIRTFTDDTGMTVTYDANEEESYRYDVDPHGVLTYVYKEDEEGKAVDITSKTVELKWHADNPYYSIGEDVFHNIKKEEKIEYVIFSDFPNDVQITIGENAFKDYSGLKGISLPTTLTSIGDSAFKNCPKLTQLSVPKAVESIGDSAFEGDTSLFMVYIKDSTYSSMTSIGKEAFKNCRRLEKFGSDTEFILPGYLESIGESAFEDCRAIKKVALPDSIKEQEVDDPENDGQKIIIHSLGKSVFKNCTSLTDVTLSGEEIIPESAFEGCTNLLSVKFASGNKTIGKAAFKNCSRLAEVIFSYTVILIEDYAFSGCSQLRYAEFPNAEAKISNNDAFPNTNGSLLWMRGFINTDVYRYATSHNNMRFIAYNDTTNEYFQYTYKCLTDEAGTVTFSLSDKQVDPNKANSAKGVKAGEKIYVSVNTTSSVKLVAGSLRCNGTPISGPDSENYYVFKMPVGGAYVTAEFESTGKDKNKYIAGSAADVEYELSNGSDLKVGQTSRMFLIDTSAEADNSVIPSYKIEFSSSNKTVASVSSDGTIKALKKGTAYITAIVYDRDGKAVYREATIQVENANVYSLKLKPYGYDRNIVTVDEDDQSAVLRKEDVEAGETTFTLIATAYDLYDDNMSVALKWSTSDSKVAKLAVTSTKDAESQNTITIPKGASGEATITVTATNTNPEEADNKTVTSKFTVRVIDRTPRLSASTVTLNPYREDGVAVEVISAYVDEDEDEDNIIREDIQLRRLDDKDAPYSDFRVTDVKPSGDNNSILKFNIISNTADLKDGNYQACVYVVVADNSYYLPLTIKVKRSAPNPKVKFASNQPKMNFFYADGGTEVKPVISGLVNDVVSGYELENLSNSGDDAWFNKNFEIDNDGVITRSDEPMHYTAKNKPVVTGYLVLRFDNYKEGFNEKKFKITIPNKTVKPSYKLERTSDTFNLSEGSKDVTLAVLDKKTKTPVDLAECEVSVLSSSTTSAVTDTYIDEAGIHMNINPSRGAGKVVLSVTNEDEWDQDLQFTYSVKVSNKKTTFKLSKSTVTLNKYYAGEQTVKITLKANQYGIEPTNTDFETPDLDKLSESKAEQYDYINVEWNSGDQVVEVSLVDGCEEDIKSGSYKFTCYPLDELGNKVTLTVKVTAAAPKLSLKGSAKLNRLAGDQDIASLEVNIKNLPSGSECYLDTGSTTIEYVTNNEDYMGFEGNFNWDWEEDEDNRNKQILRISLGSDDIASKTYTFKMTPGYEGCSIPEDKVKPIKFKVTVYSKTISVSLKAKGKINLLERFDETYPDINSGAETYSAASTNVVNYSMIETSQDALVSNTAEIQYDAADYGSPSVLSNEDGIVGFADGTVAVAYDYNDSQVELAINGDPVDGTDDSDVINVDAENKSTEEYVFTATAKTGFIITSINAYATSEYDLSEESAVHKIEGLNDGSTGTITIDAKTDLSEFIDGITVVVKADDVRTDTTKSYTVTFEQKGEHTRIEKTADTTTEEGYSFDVETDAGYDVIVAAYATSEYKEKQGEATKIDVNEDPEGTYTISIDAIKGAAQLDDEGITIVVTDIYTVTIKDDTDVTTTDPQYSIDGGLSYETYSDSNKPTVEHEKNISIQFTVDEELLEENGNIVVEATNGGVEVESEADEDNDYTFTYNINNITDNTTITISIETTGPTETTHNVTLSKSGAGVETVKYALIGADENLDSDTSFEDYEEESIPVGPEEKLAIGVTSKEGYSIKSVTATTESESPEGTISTELTPEDNVEIEELENVYLLETVTADTTIFIEAEYINGKTIAFIRKGVDDHATIKKSTDDSKINGGDLVTTTEEGYSFDVVTNGDYLVDVAAYTSEDYDDDPETADKLEDIFEKETQQDGNITKTTYKIPAENIEEDITIVVTDIYTVTIKDDTDVTTTDPQYSIDGGLSYETYSDSNKPTVEHEKNISIQFTVDEEQLEENGNIVVEATNGEVEVVSEASEDNDYTYTYNINNITDNTTITISTEVQHKVTLSDPEDSLPEKVDGFAFAIIGDEDSITNEDGTTINPNIDFEEYSDGIDVPDGQKLALKITIKDPHVIVNSVTYTTVDAESYLKNGPVVKLADGSTDYYFYMEEKLETSATISIETEEVYIITFDRKGGKAKIEVVESVESDESETKREITDTTAHLTKGNNVSYKFTLTAGEDCGVAEPEVYTTDSYQSDNPDSVDKISEDGSTYEIPNIEKDITIVITDTYTVTIVNSTSGSEGALPSGGNLQDLSYQVGDTYLPYEGELTVPVGEDVRFKVTPADGRTIVVLDTSGDESGIIFSAENEAEEPSVYAIRSINTNKSFKLVDAYNVKAYITQVKEKDTASISYIGVEPDNSGKVTLVGNNTLSFQVTPNEGYILSEVSYYKVSDPEGKVTLYNKDNVGEETVGDHNYTIENIDDDIVIEVMTEVEDTDHYTIVFNVSNATINYAGTTNPKTVKIDKDAVDKSIAFSVTPDQGYKLRRVESDGGTLDNNPAGSEMYTFTLSADEPDYVTNIDIEATPLTNINLTFTGLTTADNEPRAKVYTVTFSGDDNKTMTTVPVESTLSCKEDDTVDFIVDAVGEYPISGVTATGGTLTSEKHTVRTVIEGGESQEYEVTVYTLDLKGVTEKDIEVRVSVVGDEVPDEPEESESQYTLKNSIVYTPVISGLNDKVVAAKIYDANGKNPNYGDEESVYFNIEVDQKTGLLYVMPKEDLDDEETYLKNKTTYQVKIWVELEHYRPGDEQGGIDEGLWVNKTLKIKTAQVLPKVITDTKTPLNLYQSNMNYTASFVVTLKDGSIGEIEGIEFGENDTKAIESFELEPVISNDGSVMIVTLSLIGSPQYAVNSTNKIKMYVKFKNQAKDTTGTPITMTVKINK